MDSKPEVIDMSEDQPFVEQIPSVVKSHLPPHLVPRSKKPLEASKEVNGAAQPSTPAHVSHSCIN